MTETGGPLESSGKAAGWRGTGSLIRAALPSILIAAAWVGLWFLWPWVKRSQKASVLPEPRVVLARLAGGQSRSYMDPTMFGRSSRVGFALGERPDSGPGDLPYRPPSVSGTLAAPGPAPAGPVALTPDMSAAAASKGSFVPEWPVGRAFSRPPAREPSIHMAVRGELAEAGLRVPELPAAVAARTAGTWSVSAYVEVDESGLVSEVFLESGTQDAALNADVVRGLSRAVAENAGRRRSGRVEVGWGE